MEFSWIIILIVFLAFICEFTDSSLGMGYGTTLTPVLLLLGYESAQIVPAVLISECITGIVSAIFHAIFKNMKLGYNKKSLNEKIDINPKKLKPSSDIHFGGGGSTSVKMEKTSLKERIKDLTIDTKVVLILTIFGICGTLIASITSAIFSYNVLFKFIVKLYIGVMVIAMGILILALRNRQIKFSFKRITVLGAIAGFNKGISGGGYGPLTVSGQILSGREGRNAIASTSLSEGIICFVGASAFIITTVIRSSQGDGPITVGELGLAPFLILGAVLSAPIAAFTTKAVNNRWLKLFVGIATVILGAFSLTRTILGYLGIW
ncbi:MAG: sulfite exporter TauE/SafE family protein [Asgard group archaeon]|nr:sulfite exporter TauE/SafE family protein [Asgard group archaeon]